MSATEASTKISIAWIRRDLRLEDSAVLSTALKSGLPVQVLFIFDHDLLSELKDKSDRRVDFIYQALSDIQKRLVAQGAQLHLYYGSPLEVWKKIIATKNVEQVFCASDYEPGTIARDEKIAKFLKSKGIEFNSIKDQVIFEKNEVTKDDGQPYTVFTPYKKKWLKTLRSSDYKSYVTDFKNLLRTKKKIWLDLSDIDFKKTDMVFEPPQFDVSLIKKYDGTRDFPALDATSRLGIHLRFGTVSVRQCVQIAIKNNETWLSELIWREFFMQILFHFPHVEKKAFRPEYDNIKWRVNADEFQAWCEGRTGYALVDAGMRELNTTGFMHNRVRMVTASFLVKDLMMDWRKGERYFAEKLLDYDLSANNGNWQWSAGTGCDAAPYFRIFNPEQQQKKFDPKFEYIKKWIPEFETAKYPKQIVDHSMARIRTVVAYKKALKK
ncbi:MAG: deoxyribodipyrimidine photo-lyase [Bdellovibrionota bacterium]